MNPIFSDNIQHSAIVLLHPFWGLAPFRQSSPPIYNPKQISCKSVHNPYQHMVIRFPYR